MTIAELKAIIEDNGLPDEMGILISKEGVFTTDVQVDLVTYGEKLWLELTGDE